MGHGGSRIGAGKKKGSLNKRTIAIRALTDKAIDAGVTPLEVMLENMRFYYDKAKVAEQILMDAIAAKKQPDDVINALRELCSFRDESTKCAEKAAPYVHSRLAALTVSADPDNPFVMVHKIERVFTDQIEDFENNSATDISATH